MWFCIDLAIFLEKTQNYLYLCSPVRKTGQFWWDGWVAETTSLLNWRTGNRTAGSNPALTAERKPQVVDKQTLAALFVSWKLHGNCTKFFTDLQKIPIWGGSNGFLPHFYRCWMSGFSPLFTAVLTAVYSGCRIPFFRLRAIRRMEIAPLLTLIAKAKTPLIDIWNNW